MKKLIIAILAFFMAGTLHAQLFTIGNQEIGFLYLGPKVGMGGSWVSKSKIGDEKTATLLSYQFGVVGKFGLTERLSIQPELVYSRKGNKVKTEGTNFDYTGKTFADYLGIPILAKFSFIKIGNFRFHGSGGIYNNISLSHKTETIYSDQTYEHEVETEFYKTVDFGFSFGGGAEYELDNGLLVGELLIEHGVVDMYTDDVSTGSNRNTSVSIAVTYLFDFVDLTAKAVRENSEESFEEENNEE